MSKADATPQGERGVIINTASRAVKVPALFNGAYAVAKAGVVSLSRALKVELADKNIDVTVSCPTVFKSHLLDTAGHEGDVVEGVTARGLARDMSSTDVTSEDVAVHLIRAMAKRRMYSVPQRDAKLQWWLARSFPQTFEKFVLYMYRHRLWVFNDSAS